MADVKIIDIDSEQWNMKDQNARDRLTVIEEQQYKLTTENFQMSGFTFSVKLKKIAEDNNYNYYQFFFGPTNMTLDPSASFISLYPQDMASEQILSVNLNILQNGNAGVQQRTQHPIGQNGCGIVTYLAVLSNETNWTIGGFGIMRKTK